jgi:beta-mannanase
MAEQFFKYFPTIDYDPTGNKNYKTIKDILIRVKMKDTVRGHKAVFSKYDVKEGQRPEDVAFEEYGDPGLHWVVLMMNEMTNPYYDWPMGLRDLERFVASKYADVNAIHHYEIAQSSGDTNTKIHVDSTTIGAEAITNYEYEEAVNDKKKQIRLLDPVYITQITTEFLDEVIS